MKKAVSIILVAVVSLMFSACSTVSTETIVFLDIELVKLGEENRIEYFDLGTIEKSSDVIVIGTFTDYTRQEEKYQYDDRFDKDVLTDFASYNTIEISQVIQGDVKVGDTLIVAQEYAVVDKKLLTYSKLTPMIKGDTWIFFLFEGDSDSDDTFYWCTGDSDGRYPVKDCENSIISQELGVYDKSDFNEAIYNELLEKYDL